MDLSTAASLVTIAEQARTRMRGHDRAAAIDDLEPRYPEMLDALDWLLARATSTWPIASATRSCRSGWRPSGSMTATRGSPGPFPQTTDDPRRARAVYDHGYLVFWAGRYDVAGERFERARALAAGRDPTVVALALAGSARVALDADPAEAVRLLREGLGHRRHR